MRKGICSKCQKVVEVDETQPNFRCPECGAEDLSEPTIKNYYRTISLLSRKAEVAVKGSTDYKEGFANYSKLHELCDTDLNILMWTTLSRIYCSDLHNIYIKEATDILIKGSEKVEINNENVIALSDALNKIRLDINIIINALKFRADESVYSLNNYHKAIDEYVYYLETYIKIYEGLGELNKLFKENKTMLEEEIDRVNKLKLEKIEVKSSNATKHDYLDEKGKPIIDVFPNKKKLYTIRMALLAVTILGAAISFVGAILLATNVSQVAKIVVLSIGLPMFIGGYFIGHKLKSINLNLNY